jgi:hypothetical protein
MRLCATPAPARFLWRCLSRPSEAGARKPYGSFLEPPRAGETACATALAAGVKKGCQWSVVAPSPPATTAESTTSAPSSLSLTGDNLGAHGGRNGAAEPKHEARGAEAQKTCCVRNGIVVGSNCEGAHHRGNRARRRHSRRNDPLLAPSGYLPKPPVWAVEDAALVRTMAHLIALGYAPDVAGRIVDTYRREIGRGEGWLVLTRGHDFAVGTDGSIARGGTLVLTRKRGRCCCPGAASGRRHGRQRGCSGGPAPAAREDRACLAHFNATRRPRGRPRKQGGEE